MLINSHLSRLTKKCPLRAQKFLSKSGALFYLFTLEILLRRISRISHLRKNAIFLMWANQSKELELRLRICSSRFDVKTFSQSITKEQTTPQWAIPTPNIDSSPVTSDQESEHQYTSTPQKKNTLRKTSKLKTSLKH